MDEKFNKLVSFSEQTFKTDDNNILPLRTLIEEEYEITELIEIIPNIIERSDAFQILNCMFAGLSQKPIAVKKRLKIIETVMLNLKLKKSSSYDQRVPIILDKLILELDQLKTNYLVKLSNVCLDILRDNESSVKISWKELLPKILSILSDKNELTYGGSEISGKEYKHEIIKTLCLMNINSASVIPLATMFTGITMTTDEHDEVVNKLCNMFDITDIKDLPALVQQLLRLCKDDHSVIVFLKLRNFFSKYLHLDNNGQDAGITDEQKKEIVEAEIKILDHIEVFAGLSRLNELMKLCKNASSAACLLLDPFLLAVLLILSSNPTYTSQVLDLLRILINEAVTEEEKKKDSAWLSNIIDSKFNIDQLFSKLIQSRLCDNDKVIQGLVNLGFTLLSVSGIKSKETIFKKIWRIGRIILVSLIKKHPTITKDVLKNLTDRIITGSISQQYTDCLLHLCNVASVTMVDNFPMVVRILEYLNSMPGIVSQRIVTALIPLVQISHLLRDSLIMCLRKALFSTNIEIRHTAVLGFLQLLKFLKLQHMSAYSQNTLTQTTFQGPSVFTQICMDVHTQQTSSQVIRTRINTHVNEAICLEVLGILKRCFIQQASVKTTLYKGLFAAISVNPELCIIILDVLLDHFSVYYENDVDVLPPIRFNKVIISRNGEIILHEPIGPLILLIQDILSKTRTILAKDPNMDEPRCFQKLIAIIESLIDRLSNCDLNHFQLDENVSITDTSIESVKLKEITKQILSTYEALMACTINSWNVDSSLQMASKLKALHKAYQFIVEFAKNAEKTSKKKEAEHAEKKSKNSKKDRNSSTVKKLQFRMPQSILSLKTVTRLLSLFLLDEIDWSSNEAILEIKPKRQLFSYAVSTVLDVIQQMKIRLNEEQRSSAVFNDVVSLAKLIFSRCLSRYDEVADFDNISAVTSIECFSEIISLMLTHYKSKFSQFLEDTLLVSVDDGLPRQLVPLLKVYKNLLKKVLKSDSNDNDTTDVVENDGDPANKILTTNILNALSIVVLALPTDHEITSKIMDWLISIAEKHCFDNANSEKVFMNLLFTMHARCRSDLTLFDSLSLQLCHIFPTINEAIHEKSVRPLLMVTDRSKTSVLPMLCNTLISYLEDADYMITRFKSEHLLVSYFKDEDDSPNTQYGILKRREKDLCQHIIHVTLMAQNIITIAAPTGPCLESIIKYLTRTFSLLTSLTKYFILRSTSANPIYQNALFHKLVKVAGSQFLRQEASELLLYIEKDYENENKKSLSHLNNQAKKQSVLIPKLVTELESFPKAVMQLSKKCKDTSLSNHVKLTITRDFRLNVKKVDELISKQNESDSEPENDENNSSAIVATSRSKGEPSQKRRRVS